MEILDELINKVATQVEQKIEMVIEKRLGTSVLSYNQKLYMNKKEASQYIGVSFNTLQKFIDKGMPVIEVDGVKLISKRDIDEFLEKKKQ
ncbi:helix-turn-helix domain-containing protein [Lysinibacillus xylanilyticus]|uniref:helix-turn-helix domain-containing protein n=1 Tax=Lysinibacillus xylanilyticus TaxID=582475 RepID=UPI0037FF7555